jgi:hypothetical protein
MTDSPKNHTSPVEFLLQDKSPESISENFQLVRILSRSSTLPKIGNIYIQSLNAKPDSFFIHAGKSISIGTNLLSNSVAALICLRYGLEWQIWYKSQTNKGFDPRICDLAASRVAAKFYELTPREDKKAIDHVPEQLADIIFRFQSMDDFSTVLSESDFKTLGALHDQEYAKNEITNEHLNILNHLANPLEYLLMSGGDLRLQVDPNQLLNVYGCRPFPRPKAFTFASSTATSISNVAFNQAENQRELLIRQSFKNGVFQTAVDFSKKIKSQLKEALKLPDSSSIIFAPSGTDVSLKFAGICQAIFKKDIVHILVAADETGSGVPLALQGKHFSDRTAQASIVKKGSGISGFRDVEVRSIGLRDESGQLKRKDDIEDEISTVINDAIENNKQPVLHAVDQSKLGYSAPGDEYLQQLDNDYGKTLLVLVDNSQLRMDQGDIQNYINRGYAMTITGSKFFTGPPFNGALIIPEDLTNQWSDVEETIPDGLNEYFYKNEWPGNCKLADNLNEGLNLGVAMRWYASIVEIERYFQTPLSLRYLGLEMFCDHVAKSIERSPFLEHLPDHNDAVRNGSEFQKIKDRRTIFPFFVKKDQRVLDQNEIDKVYHLLNRDLSDKLDFESDELKRLAGQDCHIGQPVDAIYRDDGTASGAVRISLGSRVISESWKDQDINIFFQKIEEQMTQVDTIIRKIKLILNYPEWYSE